MADQDYLVDLLGDVVREFKPVQEQVWEMAFSGKLDNSALVRSVTKLEDLLAKLGPKRLIEMEVPFRGLRDEDHGMQNEGKLEVGHE